MFKERTEYGNPKKLEETMRKVNFCYDQNQNIRDNIPNWKNKRRKRLEQKNKGTKFYDKSRNNYWGYQGSNFKNNKQHNHTTTKEKEVSTAYNKILQKWNH